MPRIVRIDATGIVAKAKMMMPPPPSPDTPQDARLIRHQIAWAHSMILAGSKCEKSDPAFRARCAELLEVLDALRMAWACHFGRNWKTGQPVDPRLIHPTPLDHVILSARVGPFQLYRYEPIRRIARACRAIEQEAERVKPRPRPKAPPVKEPAAPVWKTGAADEAARLKKAQEELRRFRAGTLRDVQFPDEGSAAWFSEADRMRNAFATREAMRVRERQRVRVR